MARFWHTRNWITTMGDVVITMEYTGTLESAEEMINNLQLEEQDYLFNIKTKTICVLKNQIVYYKPGDHYTYRLSETLF